MNIDQKILDGLNYCKELDVLKYFKSDLLFINNDKANILTSLEFFKEDKSMGTSSKSMTTTFLTLSQMKKTV